MKRWWIVVSLFAWACSGDDGAPARSLDASLPTGSLGTDASRPDDAAVMRSDAASAAPIDARLEQALDVTRPPWKLDAPTPYFRIVLGRDAAGVVTLRGAQKPTLVRVPVPALYPEYVLTAYAGERVVAAAPLRFPTEGHVTMPDGDILHETITLTESRAVAMLDASQAFDRLDVLAPDGAVALTIPSAELESAAAARRIEKAGPSPLEALRAKYNVIFLEPAFADLLGPQLLQGGTVVEPDERMVAAIAGAFERAAPLLLNGVSAVAWVDWPEGNRYRAAYGATVGSFVMLNARELDRPGVAKTIFHESMHALDHLVSAAAGLGATDKWPAESVAAVRPLIERFRLARGLRSVWETLHTSGFEEGYSGKYQGKGKSKGLNPDDVRMLGFATPYGAETVGEDIAEYLATTEAELDSVPGICPVFAGVTQLTPRLAIPYAKLLLLNGLGALKDTSFQRCTNGIRFDDGKRGISFPDHATALFQDGLRAGITPGYFRVLANGPSNYGMLIEIPLASDDASPLGLHRLDDVWLPTLGYDNNAIYLANDNVDLARASAGGLVLVAENSAQHTSGAVFGLALQNGFGLTTDRWSYGSFVAP